MNEILCGDCLTLLPKIEAESVDLVFADPPFNIGYSYDVYHDELFRDDYLMWAKSWIVAAARVMKPDSSIFVAINDELAAEYKLMLDSAGLTMRNWIIWHYEFGPHQRRKFGRNHAHILYYVKDASDFTFNDDAIRIESERQRMGDKRANPAGRVPGDVWSIPRLPGNARERTGHPCQMSESILSRIIKVASNPGDIVLDPFAGSGTTLAVAKKLGRSFIGMELSLMYYERIRVRLDEIKAKGVA